MEDEHDIITAIDIQAAIKNIPNNNYRSLLVYFLFEDMEPEDIADAMNISISNFYNMKRRALAHLVKQLKKGGYHD